TPPQLKYWRVLADPIPEAALSPNLHYSIIDTVDTTQVFSMAFKNLTPLGMDSILVNYMIVDESNTYTQLISTKYKPLQASDSIHLDLSFTVPSTFGNYYLFVDANPFNNQPEQYHPNNIAYVPFVVGHK